MNNNLIITVCSFVLAPLIFSSQVQAAIYKCTNAKEEVYYNDKPCPVNDKESQMQAVKDPVGGYIPPEFVVEPAEKPRKGVVIGSSSEVSLENIKENLSDSSKSSDSSSEISKSSKDASSNGTGSNSEANSSGSNEKIVDTVGSSKESAKYVVEHEGYYKDEG